MKPDQETIDYHRAQRQCDRRHLDGLEDHDIVFEDVAAGAVLAFCAGLRAEGVAP